MKKLIFIVSASLVFGFASTALAQGFVPLAAIPGLTNIQPTTGGLATFFNNLYKYLIGIAAALAVIQIVWAGLDIAFFHKDAVSTIADDKGKIYNAIFGLVLVLSPVLVFSIINPSILNLTLNLPPLDTKAGVAPTTQTQPTATSNGTIRVTSSTGYSACGADCTAAQTACVNAGGSPDVVCLKSDGSVDPSGRSGIFNYTCAAGETKSVACDALKTVP